MTSVLFTAAVRRGSMALAALAMVAVITPAHAGTISVVNGGFESTTSTTPGQTSGQPGYQGFQLTGWTNNSVNGTLGYNFVVNPGQADTTGVNGSGGNLKLYGPGTGSNNGLTASSPLGGNYLVMDGAYEQASISQVINGLVAGQKYTVSFYYAGAQQSGYDGATTEAFDVSLGNETLETPVLQDVNHGFTGWQQENMTFTATGASETLAFLAVGTPNGVPPMSLLDGVTVSSQTPEPSSLAFMITGLAGVSGIVRKRFKK